MGVDRAFTSTVWEKEVGYCRAVRAGDHVYVTGTAPIDEDGSASTLVAVTIIHKNDLAMSFGRFVKLAIPFAVLQIVLATVYVLLFLR